MKILVAYPEELPSPQARAVQVISNAAGLAAAGADAALAYGRRSDAPLNAADVTGEIPGTLKLLPLPLIRRMGIGPVRISWNWIFHAALDLRIRSFQPDWVYCRHLKLAERLIRRRGLKVVYEAHTIFCAEAANSCDPDVIRGNRKWGKLMRLEQDIFRNAAAVVATSGILAKEIEKLFGRKNIPVLPHGVWPHHQVPWNPDPRQKRILYVGQFYIWKDVDTLIQAMRLLPKDVKLDLIGGRSATDPDRERLKILVESLDLQDRIRFLGQMAPTDLAKHLAGATVVVITLGSSVLATRFTCPIKLSEYLAGGRPVVAPHLPIIEERAKDAVVYYRVGNSTDLAETIGKLLSSPQALTDLSVRALQSKAAWTWEDRGRAIIEALERAY